MKEKIENKQKEAVIGPFKKKIDSLTEDKHKESGLHMISWIAQLKDN